MQDWIYSKSYHPSIESCILLYLHIEVNKYDFNPFVEFNLWKQHEEDVTMSRYVKATGDRHTRRHQSTLRRYYCNRSGRYITKGKCLRHLKVQGTCKIGSNCQLRCLRRSLLLVSTNMWNMLCSLSTLNFIATNGCSSTVFDFHDVHKMLQGKRRWGGRCGDRVAPSPENYLFFFHFKMVHFRLLIPSFYLPRNA